jgi:Protein of unknown function (DUF3037)
MSAISYTYSIVRYVHDPSAGEILNVGVVLYAPSVPYVAARCEHRYTRLSHAFAGFDGESYRTAIRRFERSIERLKGCWQDSFPSLRQLPPDVGALTAKIWSDSGLGLRLGPVLAGVTDDPAESIDALFDRLVVSRQPRGTEERRTDREVWSVYQHPLARKAVSSVLRPKTFDTPNYHLDFEHAFKNERWHVLQPVSLDYARPASLQDKAVRLLGQASVLKGNPELGRLYLLLGAPHQRSHRDAYEKAKRLLQGMPVEHELVEEDQAEEFAGQLAEYIREHSVDKREDAR